MHPTWAKIAQEYLAIQGSAVPCEQAFSSSGLTGTDHSNHLSPQTFEALQLLKHAYNTSVISVNAEIREDADVAFGYWDSEDEEEV